MGRKHLDTETGEISTEPDFVKLYIKNLCQAKGITGRQAAIFNFMLAHMNDYNEVSYSKSSKDRFLSRNKTTNATFNNNIKALIDNGLIERIGKGEFRVNKKYAVKVEWGRVQSIVWTTKYTKDGKTEKVTFSQD